MASSTLLAPTLPDVQAAPALTATPSRSRRMTSRLRRLAGQRRDTRCWRRAAAPRPTNDSIVGVAAMTPASSLSRRAAMRCAASASRPTSAAAAPKPTMPATFSVPPRRRRSWPPPLTKAGRLTPSRTIRAPTPRGPPSLCAETTSVSAPSSAKFSGRRPGACTASMCSATPCSRARAAASATG